MRAMCCLSDRLMISGPGWVKYVTWRKKDSMSKIFVVHKYPGAIDWLRKN